MNLIDDLLTKLPNGPVQDVRIGAFWTAVVVDVAGQRRCGLASTLRRNSNHHHGSEPAVPAAGSFDLSGYDSIAEAAHYSAEVHSQTTCPTRQ